MDASGRSATERALDEEALRAQLRDSARRITALEERVQRLERTVIQGQSVAPPHGTEVRGRFIVCQNVHACGLEFRMNRHHPDHVHCCSDCRHTNGVVHSPNCPARTRPHMNRTNPGQSE